jgi:formylglycine-generating enzyme required for sulfatase activity
MVSVPGGTYTQYTPMSTAAENFSHTVSDFQIGKYEVTYELWHTVFQWALSNGYHFGNPGREGHDGALTSPGGAAPTGARHEPVTTISWRDAVVWCNAYSEMSGYLPVYYSDPVMSVPRRDSTNHGVIDMTPGSQDNPYVNWGSDGYRLPTEGEWQYAASYMDGISWTPWDYASGAQGNGVADSTFTDLVAWHVGNSGSKTHDVATKAPNQLAIHDMSGNVSEWCWDLHGQSDPCPGPTETQSDYTGPSSGIYRVGKGDSWYRGQCLIGTHGFGAPFALAFDRGFRVARRP